MSFKSVNRVGLSASVTDNSLVFTSTPEGEDFGLSTLVDESDPEFVRLLVPFEGSAGYLTVTGTAEDLGTLGRFLAGVGARAKKTETETDE